ncbi:MAG: BMP family ABC transporter substrate-binding protein [Spirochaetes bacterium]|nr:BMP family ABC transporter substrate-binding protein [Spirochaetota bacterium]
MTGQLPLHGSGSNGEEAPAIDYVSIMLPDTADSHPLYQMIVDGARAAVAEREGFEVEVVTSVRRGDTRLRTRAGDRNVALLVVGGGALLEDGLQAAADHPDTSFLIVDGEAPTLANAAGLLINRREQAFLAGYIAGLRLETAEPTADAGTTTAVTASATAGLLIETGLYMSEHVVRPGYRLGLKAAADENRERIRRLPLGASASVLRSRIEDFDADGTPVLLPALYANRAVAMQGLRETNIEVVWLDSARPESGRNRVLAAIALELEDAVAEMIARILDAGPEATETVEASFRTGRMTLNTDFNRFESAFDPAMRRRIEHMAERFKTGELSLPTPQAPAPPRDPQDQ